MSSSDALVWLRLDTQKQVNAEYLKALALAHECLLEADRYQGPSPDEVCLVEFAHQHRFQFLHATQVVARLATPQGPLHCPLLAKFPFDSDRKRMSVVLRDPSDGHLKLYCKGADSII